MGKRSVLVADVTRGLTVAGLLLAAVLAALTPRPARACSAGEDFNPVAASEVIVVGRLLRWEEGDSIPPSRSEGSGFVPIRVTMAVERTLKGSTPATITIVDRSSLVRRAAVGGRPEEMHWAGGAGACGSFDADPTGLYAVMGLGRNPDGTYRPNRLLTFYLSDRHPSVAWDAIVRRLSLAGPSALPLTGAAARARFDAKTPPGLLVVSAAGVALLVAVTALRRRVP